MLWLFDGQNAHILNTAFYTEPAINNNIVFIFFLYFNKAEF